MNTDTAPFGQTQYQIRFEWGLAGLQRVSPTDIVVVVDVLRFSSHVSAQVAAGAAVDVAPLRSRSLNGAAVTQAAAELAHRPVVIAGALRNAAAVADAILAHQVERGTRQSVLILAAGERVDPESTQIRHAVEDQLGAGAIIAALGDLGIDYTSPEAAVAGESFRALRNAVRHLVSASGSGRELSARGAGDTVAMASELNVDAVAPVLRDGFFVPSAE